ncbi:MAG: inositol monophosphatase [Planctomycetaceae bacterium]|nr:inositol monophosphatase [Planctomycetaceae bacterium]MBV8605920.1 inositol monophosphatase [Singulisphaera sp.]MBV8231014.1 inositol monophosphatase [Planctomycetaceae bacterium]MBV8268023.1 inositol monophosphatase [Planctomycetaceae bacterium]MBV8314337.1 inositol monophosphatase [Planctomycetaceae bacterium]
MKTPELTIAEEAARAAGAILKRHFHAGVVMRNKDIANLVSDADIEAERAIVEVIGRAFPDHEVLGEEVHRGDVGAEHLWVVDPLDGTNNYAHHVPHFAVSIAYHRRGQPECGLVYNPMREEWHTAVRGDGAYQNGVRVLVGEQTRLDEVLVGIGFYYDRGVIMEATLASIRDLKLRHIHGIRRFGTASLDLCMVGLGMFGAYFEYELSPWDFAAGRLFVEEAGGLVTTARGEPLSLVRSSILATNGSLHEPILEILRAHHPGEPGAGR